MNLPFYIRLESGLLLNLSLIVAIHPRQPNGSVRVQAEGVPSLIVISPVTDKDEEDIQFTVAMLQQSMFQQLDHRNLRPDSQDIVVEKRVALSDDEIVNHKPAKKKSKNGRRRPKVAA